MTFGIYVHYPYCTRICPYCDFSVETSQHPQDEAYTSALIKEFELRIPTFAGSGKLRTLYFGGGTPSLWSHSELARFLKHILDRCAHTDDLEVTLELNPEDTELNDLIALRDLGINRLSIGAQALDDRVLRRLGRAHSAAQVVRCIEGVKQAGFCNWTVDLMHGLEGQTLASVIDDVQQVIALGTPHVSTYQLTVEPGTRFGARADRGERVVLDEAHLETMYQSIEGVASRLGLVHYEISNAARPGFESQHNLGYWLGRPYMGLGPGAHGFYPQGTEMVRYSNRAGLAAYLSAIGKDVPLVHLVDSLETLQPDACMEDLLLTGLRLKRGIEPTKAMLTRYGTRVEALRAEGLLTVNDGRWSTTVRGRLLLDHVLRRLLT